MNEKLVLKNHLRKARNEKGLSQMELANMVGQFNPTAKLALILCIALDKTFEEIFYFDISI